jgi:hypothetical protein
LGEIVLNRTGPVAGDLEGQRAAAQHAWRYAGLMLLLACDP